MTAVENTFILDTRTNKDPCLLLIINSEPLITTSWLKQRWKRDKEYNQVHKKIKIKLPTSWLNAKKKNAFNIGNNFPPPAVRFEHVIDQHNLLPLVSLEVYIISSTKVYCSKHQKSNKEILIHLVFLKKLYQDDLALLSKAWIYKNTGGIQALVS